MCVEMFFCLKKSLHALQKNIAPTKWYDVKKNKCNIFRWRVTESNEIHINVFTIMHKKTPTCIV